MDEPAFFGLRTLLMTTDAVGGVFTYALELSRELTKAGTYVVLASMGPQPTPAQRRAAASISGLELWVNDLRLEWMDEPWSDVDRAGDWLLDLEWRVRPDLIHLNQYAYGGLPFSAPVLIAAHSCVCSWFRSVRGTPPPEKYDLYRRRVAQGLAAAGAVVAPTRTMLDALAQEYGEGPSHQLRTVVFNGRSQAPFDPSRRKEPIVFSAGRLWDEAKNMETLARAAADLSWPVIVGGSTEHPDGRPASLRGLRAIGPLDEPTLATWLARAAIFALPARYEPFGYTALEAALSGCALVLGDIASLREVWQDAALYTSPDDAAELAGVVERLARDESARLAMAKKAYARAVRLTPDVMARHYCEIYADLLAQERKPSSRSRPMLGRHARGEFIHKSR